ncbi:hypothetical protein [Weissella bombi]|uniref:Uncharacterized protein n=1 Tax=Weissella bombi TaxID=1505725 RepID=A0A1C3ZK53_9LACO|nr:hypothetical protein [Weissella bombi]SCB82731.1 hypothetical protein GA0061074_10256 [Weissella bombi]
MLKNTRLFKIFAKDSLNHALFIMGIGAIVAILIFIWQLLPFVPHDNFTVNGDGVTVFKDRVVVYEGVWAFIVGLGLGLRMFISSSKSWNKSKYVLLPARIDQFMVWNLVGRFVVNIFAIFIVGVVFLGLEWLMNSSYHDNIVDVLMSVKLYHIGVGFDSLIALYLFVNLAVVTNNWLMGFVSDKWQQRVKVFGLILMIFIMGYGLSWLPDNVFMDILIDLGMLGLIWYLLRYHNEAR